MREREAPSPVHCLSQHVAHDEREIVDLVLGEVCAEMVGAGGGRGSGAEKDTDLGRVGSQLVEQREQLRRVQRSLPQK